MYLLMNGMRHGGGGMWTWLAGIAVAIILLLLIVLLVRSVVKEMSAQGEMRTPETPMDILKKRYARGEIDEEEFDRRKERLEE